MLNPSFLSASVCLHSASFILSFSFIHPFIQGISIAPLQVNYYSEALPTARILCRSFTLKRRRQLPVKVPTWRPERDSNPRPFGLKVPNLPMTHHASHVHVTVFTRVYFYPAVPFHHLLVDPFRNNLYHQIEIESFSVVCQTPSHNLMTC